MKKTIVMGAAMIMAVAMTSCKSGESAYKKAYEKAQAASAQQAATVTPAENVTPAAVAPAQVTPVQQTVTTTTTTQTVTPAAPVEPATVTVRTESVKLINGNGLKDYSVVVGSFGKQENALGEQTKLKAQGYDAQVVVSPTNMYRVIITTFANKADAVVSRDKVRATYPDAWLLYNK